MQLKMLLLTGLLAIMTDAIADEMTVYRSPTCGCCGKWLDHIKQNHFTVKDIVTNDMQAIKQRYGVSAELASCHTAVIGGYVIEGHVPAEDIIKLLQTKPDVVGIAVPGMPVGTPGMEMGARKDDYDVVSFGRDGGQKVFARHSATGSAQ